ncbi:MAG TPA: hypothetical protein VGM23_00120, partial [Armatimonadota bacterium]
MTQKFTSTVQHGAGRFWHWVRQHPSSAVILLIIGAAVQTFFELADELREQELIHYDRAILAHFPPLTPSIKAISLFLSEIVLFPYVLILIVPFLVYLLYKRRYVMAAVLALVPLVTTGVVYLLKIIFHRHRPISEIITQ